LPRSRRCFTPPARRSNRDATPARESGRHGAAGDGIGVVLYLARTIFGWAARSRDAACGNEVRVRKLPTLSIIAVLAMLMPGPARAEPVDQAPAPVTLATTTADLRVVSHNICGGASCGVRGTTGPLSSVTTLIDSYRPHVIMLQEVCWSQFEYLQSFPFTSGPYQLGFTAMIEDYTGCGVADCTVNQDADPGNDDRRCWIGQVLAAKGVLSGRDEIALGGERHQVGSTGALVVPPRTFNALCYDMALTGFSPRVVKGCTVHLRAFSDPAGESKRARTAQAARLASDLDGDIAAGKIVVIGGDFNSLPTDPAMNALYRLHTNVEHGWGRFYEADEDDTNYYNTTFCASTAAACRSGAKTIGTASKYDYIFFSETTDAHSVSGLPIEEEMSDHAFFRGLATVRIS
jgi:hypothetical protein